MNFISIILLAFAMSTDAFAAAIAKGASRTHVRVVEALKVGLLFGMIEGITPVLGWLLGSAANRFISEWDHWVAFGLLLILGLHMIYNGFQNSEEESVIDESGFTWRLVLTAVATSLDAMAIGVSLALVDVNIVIAALSIGTATFIMVTLGMLVGRVLGRTFGGKAEVVGGLVLIIVGAWIVDDHLQIISSLL